MNLASPFRLLLILLLAATPACAPQSVEMAGGPAPADQDAAKRQTELSREAQQLAALAEFQKAQQLAAQDEEPAVSLGTERVLAEISLEISGRIIATLRAKGKEFLFSRLAVTNAVPLADLKRQTEFGRLLAEYILTDLGSQGMQVSELRLGKEIAILPQTGEFLLSRNSGELRHSKPEFDYAVVGTFSNTRSTLIIQGRLVDAIRGVVETSWRYTLPLNREVVGLFYDPEADAPAPEQIYTMAVKGIGQ